MIENIDENIGLLSQKLTSYQLGPGAGDKTFADKIADILTEKGAEVIDFDWSDDTSFAEAVRGVKTVFCSLPHMEGWADVFPSFLRTCKTKKVEHFIKLSFLSHSAAGDQYRANVPFVRFHGTCDDILEQAKNDSRISYTILACSHMVGFVVCIV